MRRGVIFFVSLILSLVFISSLVSALYTDTVALTQNVNDCGTLTTANAVYTITTSISSASGTCIKITNDGIKVKGANGAITVTSAGSYSHGISIETAKNVEISNLKVASSGYLSSSVLLKDTSFSNLTNVTITLSGSNTFSAVNFLHSYENKFKNVDVYTPKRGLNFDYSSDILTDNFAFVNTNNVLTNYPYSIGADICRGDGFDDNYNYVPLSKSVAVTVINFKSAINSTRQLNQIVSVNPSVIDLSVNGYLVKSGISDYVFVLYPDNRLKVYAWTSGEYYVHMQVVNYINALPLVKRYLSLYPSDFGSYDPDATYSNSNSNQNYNNLFDNSNITVTSVGGTGVFVGGNTVGNIFSNSKINLQTADSVGINISSRYGEQATSASYVPPSNNVFNNVSIIGASPGNAIATTTGTSGSNYLYQNNSYGEIAWSWSGFLSNMVVNQPNFYLNDNYVQIKNNNVYLNPTYYDTGTINSAAIVTLRGLPTNMVNPKILRDGLYDCTPSTIPSCNLYTDLNAGTVKFKVSSWTGNYSISGGSTYGVASNSAPVWTAIPDVILSPISRPANIDDFAYSDLSPYVSDPNGDSISVSLVNVQGATNIAGCSLQSDKKVSCLPVENGITGTITVTVRASDGKLTSDAIFRVIVRNPAPIGCNGPDGTLISSGDSKNYAQKATVPFGSSCVYENRVCTNGVLSGSYGYATCLVLPANDCSGPDGSTILNSAKKTYAQSATVPFGNSCVYEDRTCTNGVLSGSYKYATCSVLPASGCAGPDGAQLSSGSSYKYYSSLKVPYGESCLYEDRLCVNGLLYGSYKYPTCSVLEASGCVGPDGSIIASGSQKSYAQSSTVPFGYTCSYQNRVCTNGALSGTYQYETCNVLPANGCEGPDGSSISHGSSVIFYPTSVVPPGQTCVGEYRTCNNGELSGTYTFANCNVLKSYGIFTNPSTTNIYRVNNTEQKKLVNPVGCNACKLVTNNFGYDLFVASNCSTDIANNDWNSFLTNYPSGVSITNCCESDIYTSCGSDNNRHFFDSCNGQGALVETCASGNCIGDTCVPSCTPSGFTHQGCRVGYPQLWVFDSCNKPLTVGNDCQGSYCSGNILETYNGCSGDANSGACTAPTQTVCAGTCIADGANSYCDTACGSYTLGASCNVNACGTAGGVITDACSGTCSGSTPPIPTWYYDVDGDGYTPVASVTQCISPGAGWSTTPKTPGDCSDSDASAFPGSVSSGNACASGTLYTKSCSLIRTCYAGTCTGDGSACTTVSTTTPDIVSSPFGYLCSSPLYGSQAISPFATATLPSGAVFENCIPAITNQYVQGTPWNGVAQTSSPFWDGTTCSLSFMCLGGAHQNGPCTPGTFYCQDSEYRVGVTLSYS